ncbi:cysteine synthase family protein [Verrucosispora sp. WMMD573]|uniref:cysteine synthase family protein n=1 Tax=Verrucosispora sp. WMMD573 TaxID=3015149 RepID=UPI00248D25E8|nr:cysteine synthase family protein [Verrucosispora sp. WMMD573]WBB53627.1 cysteine synthase family protein [Verrucosispora sp. WMMD573]
MRSSVFEEITAGVERPQIVRLGPNLFGVVFTLMKMIPARYILRQAVARGDIGPDTLIVETTSGTFGLALAMQTALLRRRLILVSDPVIDDELYRRLTDLGATVEIVRHMAASGGYQGARLERLAEIRAEHDDSFCPEQYANPDNPRSYSLVAELLSEALPRVDLLIGPVGSGGSMCGTASFLRSVNPDLRLTGVDTHRSVLFGQPDGARALRGLGNSLIPPNLDHSAFDQVHWCSAGQAYRATRKLHREHAVFQGPTSGAAFLVAEWAAMTNPDAVTVVMLPDQGYRYQSTVYDDRWLAKQGHLADPTEDRPVETSHPLAEHAEWSWFNWARRSLQEVLDHRGTASVAAR